MNNFAAILRVSQDLRIEVILLFSTGYAFLRNLPFWQEICLSLGLYKLLIDYIKIAGTGKEFLKRGFNEHLELIKAIKNRDIKKARECLKQHLDNSVKVIRNVF